MKNEEGRIKKGNIIKKRLAHSMSQPNTLIFSTQFTGIKKIGCLTTTDFQKQTT